MPIAGIHPGAMVTITDTAVGLNAFFRIYSIEKAFPSSCRQLGRDPSPSRPASTSVLSRRFSWPS
jgi:hypothetical protein